MSKSTERPTLAEIAGEAGVSLATISKVLNGRDDVAPATRQRVEELLAARGYRRRTTERSHARLIELVHHAMAGAWLMEVLSGVQSQAEEAGLGVVLSRSGDRHAPGPEWIEGVLARNPVGVVLVFSEVPASMRAALKARSIPFVVLDPTGDPADGVPTVGSTNWAGGVSAVRHLTSLGHERIAVIGGPPDLMCSQARVDGYRAAMTSAGHSIDPEWVRFGPFNAKTGLEQGGKLLDGPVRPTAIVAGDDLQAMGVYDAARERGLRIPEDLSVVGYDDIPLAGWLTPQMTTVKQPLFQMGSEAVRIVVGLASGEITGTPRLDLATTLVVRESTAPYSGGGARSVEG